MKISLPGQARANALDRNPTDVNQNYSNTLAPHVTTTRWTYTVPAGRKCLVELVNSRIMRITAAAPAGYADVAISLGNVLAYLALAELNSGDNAIGVRESKYITAQALLLAGDVLQAQTADGSTGGTIGYLASFKGTEFDA